MGLSAFSTKFKEWNRRKRWLRQKKNNSSVLSSSHPSSLVTFDNTWNWKRLVTLLEEGLIRGAVRGSVAVKVLQRLFISAICRLIFFLFSFFFCSKVVEKHKMMPLGRYEPGIITLVEPCCLKAWKEGYQWLSVWWFSLEKNVCPQEIWCLPACVCYRFKKRTTLCALTLCGAE